MSIDRKLGDFCYTIIEENQQRFDRPLTDYENNYIQDIDTINDFIEKQEHCKKYFELIGDLLKASKYISAREFEDILQKNVDEINDLVERYGYELILIIPNDIFIKSNIFYSLYFLQLLFKKHGKKINYICTKFKDIMNETILCDEIKDKEKLFIICDDISYSGTQLTSYVIEFFDIMPKYETKSKLYLNLVGLLPQSILLIEGSLLEFFIKKQITMSIDEFLIYPSNCIKISEHDDSACFRQFLINRMIKEGYDDTSDKNIELYINKINCYKLIISNTFLIQEFRPSLINWGYPSHKNKSLIYSFQSYPDDLSIFKKLCYIETPVDYIIDLDKLLEEINLPATEFFRIFGIMKKNIELNTVLLKAKYPPVKIKELFDELNLIFKENKLIDLKWLKLYNQASFMPTIQNGNYSNFQYKICELVIPKFYKLLEYNGFAEANYKKENLLDLLKIESIRIYNIDGLNKYIKYKKKYLQLKKICKEIK